MRFGKRNFAPYFLLFTFLFCVSAVAAQKSAAPQYASSAFAKDRTAIVEQLCTNICKGDFDAARKIIGKRKIFDEASVAQLADVVSEYEAIDQRRRSARENVYAEKLAKLEKFKVAADTDDVNEANDVSVVLSVIAGACEFASEKQKTELLSKPFVKQTIQGAKAKAAEYESKGEWIDAYTSCYSWLQVIDQDNKEYSDYAEQIFEKAGIKAFFQDSPCETSKERYEGVKKKMFVRAINTLNFNYVSVPDYRQMATKAIKRCELLAGVMNTSCLVAEPGSTEEKVQYDKYLPSWSASLATITNEINQSLMGISKDKFIDIFERVLALNSYIVQHRASSEKSDKKNTSPETFLPEPVLIAQFAEAALNSLDPYTVIVWPRNVKDFEKTMTNEFTGIGIEISKPKGLLTVGSLLPDTPAYNSGLDAGDIIEAVNGVDTKDMTLSCAVKNITGPAGTKVTLTVRRPEESQSRDIAITRARIIVPTIRGWKRTAAGKWLYMVDDKNKIGYVRLTNFSERTSDDLEKVLVGLEAEGLKGLILDLRFNSGGLLSSAVEVADKFIKEGLIVSTRPRYWVSTSYTLAHKKATHPDYPLVILVNRNSASASEIVAGALADPRHNRAILIGERTHGKGSVQGITSHPGGGAQLKYTMAYYYLPSGQRVESQEAAKKEGTKDWGVAPNIEIKLRSDELRKMIDVQRDNDVLVKADHDSGSTPLKKHMLEETLTTDPQLAVGVLILRSKLIQAASANSRG